MVQTLNETQGFIEPKAGKQANLLPHNLRNAFYYTLSF